MGKVEDLTGKKFNRLTVIKRVENSKNGATRWLCKCDCGNETIVRRDHLLNNEIYSCGCYQREFVSKNRLKHGCSHRTRLYSIWATMIQRCSDIKCNAYKDYGLRGISVCNKWKNFVNFQEWALNNGYHNDLSIDRIDNNGNYEPNNCRWCDRITQANNKRNNHYIIYNGETKTIAQWALLVGLKHSTLQVRLKRGWSIEKALLEPLHIKKENKNG